MPVEVPGVPAEVLDPRNTWSDKGAYDAKAKELATKFRDNDRSLAEGEGVGKIKLLKSNVAIFRK
jgi:phosphoenolpyruvate carboxykinase (ATP)